MDILGQCSVRNTILPQAAAVGTINGTGVDALGYEQALIILHLGTFVATGTLAAKVQDSADNVTYGDLPGAFFSTATDASDDRVLMGRVILGTPNAKRYLRAVGVTGTATTPYSVLVVLVVKRETHSGDAGNASFNLGRG